MRQDTRQHLAERLHPLLDRGGLLLGLLLPGRQMLLLADPFGVPLALPALARQPVFLTPLRGEALFPRREAPAPGHFSPGLRTDSYGMTISGGQAAGKARPGEPVPGDHVAADRRGIRDGRTAGMRSRTRASPHTVPTPTAAPATVSVK